MLGEGGQGAVYLVEYNGHKKVLKWYSGKKIENPEKFYENLENNVRKGKPRYTAPEIMLGKARPGIQTDAFSLAVVLFLHWTNSHPLEGKAAVVPFMDAETEMRIYGENPVFIFDPNDDSNRPVQGVHQGAISRWIT